MKSEYQNRYVQENMSTDEAVEPTLNLRPKLSNINSVEVPPSGLEKLADKTFQIESFVTLS